MREVPGLRWLLRQQSSLPRPESPLILLVGMHRSGTSLLADILAGLGVSIPGQLIPGDINNPEGYREWRQVVDLQERLLMDLNRFWPSKQGVQPLPSDWRIHPSTELFRSRLYELLKREVKVQRGPWCIKDPRTSRLLPLWLDLAKTLGLSIDVVLAIRHPADVVVSLVRRDGPLTGMDSLRAQHLWWRHTLEPIETCFQAGLTLSVVSYDHWFLAPREAVDHLCSTLNLTTCSGRQRDRVLSRIRPEHRRSHELAASVQLDGSVATLHSRLAGLATLGKAIDPAGFPSPDDFPGVRV